jgi:regulator-associated protein of mTOR
MPCFLNAADPFSMAPQKALDLIGKSLTTQYERWQPKVEMFSLLTSSEYKLLKLFFS